MSESIFYPLLKISNSKELKKFLHECVDDLTDKQKINFGNYNSGPIEWTKDDFDKAKKNIQTFYKNCVIENNFNVQLENEEEPLRDPIKSCFDIRKKDIFQYLAKTYLLRNGNNLIENIDWRLKWILGSSNLTVLREPYLQVDLIGLQNCNGKTEKTLTAFEANLEQVDQIIRDLAVVKKELSEK